MSEFGEVRQRRKQFLWAAYDLGKSRPASMVGMDEIARELGMELEPGLINAELIEYVGLTRFRGPIRVKRSSSMKGVEEDGQERQTVSA